MDAKKKEAIMSSHTFDELLDAEYGKKGSPERDKYEDDAQAFILADCLKRESARKRGLHKSNLPNASARKRAIYRK